MGHQPSRPKEFRRRLWEEQRGLCVWCAKPMDMSSRRPDGQPGALFPTFEHVVARCEGGSNSWSNVKLAHWICNQRRHPRHVHDRRYQEQVNRPPATFLPPSQAKS